MQKVGGGLLSAGDYAKPSMKMVILPTGNCTSAGLHALEATGYPARFFKMDNCLPQKNGNTMKPDFGSCHNLKGDAAVSTTSFKIDVTDQKCIAIFTEHDPEEFRRDGHYLDAERIVDEL